MLSIPLAPFRALEGVDSGAQAIREFNVTARRFTNVAAGLPEELRGELELFLYDFEDRDTVVQGLAAFETLSAERGPRVADDLAAARRSARDPAGDARRLEGLGGEARRGGRSAARPRRSAGRRRGQPARREPRLARGDRLVRSSATRSPTRARPSTCAIGGARPTRSAQRPSSCGAWRPRPARSSRSDALTAALDRSVDRIFWRGAALIALFFALLLVYRLIASRVAPRRETVERA